MKIYVDGFSRLRLDLEGMTIPLMGGDKDDKDRIEVVKALKEACEEWFEWESQSRIIEGLKNKLNKL